MADSTDGKQEGYSYNLPTIEVNSVNQAAEKAFRLEFNLAISPQFMKRKELKDYTVAHKK